MLNLKLGDKELKIKFAYEATVRSGIIKRLAEMESALEDSNFDSIQTILTIIPEMILVGAQKYHRDEFGYNYDTGEGKEEQMSKVCSLLDDFLDGEDSDFMGLFSDLQKEMLTNGFLSKMFQEEQKEAKSGKARN